MDKETLRLECLRISDKVGVSGDSSSDVVKRAETYFKFVSGDDGDENGDKE